MWEGGGRNEGCLLLSLREAYLPNFSTLLSLEPLEKVPGGGCVGECVNLVKCSAWDPS